MFSSGCRKRAKKKEATVALFKRWWYRWGAMCEKKKKKMYNFMRINQSESQLVCFWGYTSENRSRSADANSCSRCINEPDKLQEAEPKNLARCTSAKKTNKEEAFFISLVATRLLTLLKMETSCCSSTVRREAAKPKSERHKVGSPAWTNRNFSERSRVAKWISHGETVSSQAPFLAGGGAVERSFLRPAGRTEFADFSQTLCFSM